MRIDSSVYISQESDIGDLFDSNYIRQCYLAEMGTPQVIALAQSHPGRACALHGRLEFLFRRQTASARRQPRPSKTHEVLRQFARDEAADLWSFLPLARSLIESACMRLAALPDSVLCRAADALHLTCAAVNSFDAIYSNNRHLLTAAPHFGLKGRNVIA
ncbi:MAG: hypothetical protein H0X34_04600 [Chthoniobacterales bacterium]|nr:hypothetical protein [Chthoniobacterales bacterium]